MVRGRIFEYAGDAAGQLVAHRSDEAEAVLVPGVELALDDVGRIGALGSRHLEADGLAVGGPRGEAEYERLGVDRVALEDVEQRRRGIPVSGPLPHKPIDVAVLELQGMSQLVDDRAEGEAAVDAAVYRIDEV